MLSCFINSQFHDENVSIPLDSLLSQKLALHCAVLCVKVALETIDVTHRETVGNDQEGSTCSAWWYNILYVYTAATILVASRLAPAILLEVSEELVLDGWRKAMQALEQYRDTGTSIHRLITTLQLLSEAVPRQYSRIKEVTRQTEEETSARSQQVGRTESVMQRRHDVDLITGSTALLDEPDQDDEQHPDEGGTLSDEFFRDLNFDFDPGDLSWLLTIPTEADTVLGTSFDAAI